jgi:hypothetical protein
MDQHKPKRTDTLRLTQEFSEKFFMETMKRIEIIEHLPKHNLLNYPHYPIPKK